MNSKFDKLHLGLMLGILAPVLTMAIIYILKFTDSNLSELVDLLVQKRVFTKIISLCVIPNLALFFLFLNKFLYKSARGILLATILFAIFVFVTKFTL
ncbi:MAG: hypothetical protein C0597_01070 [Marinilabiliales bacterium]|nr:MAG: hypothetical protein C0597_01070 [Marinilabiliales bacterium]